MSVATEIEQRLRAAFSPVVLTVADESHKHVGHAGHKPGGETHFRVTIHAAAFNSGGRIENHRKVYAVLQTLLDSGLHALAMDIRGTI